MYIVMGSFCCISLFVILSQVDLSTSVGVAGCGCPIYPNVVSKLMDFIDSIKRASPSASEDYAMEFLIICEMERIDPLLSLWSNF